MLKVNEYYDGKVKSISFRTEDTPATVGVMEAGEYEFGTSTVEFMTVVAGTMKVQLPGMQEWQTYAKSETFIVPAGVKFRLSLEAEASYLCLYK